jgi:hypothetical protein
MKGFPNSGIIGIEIAKDVPVTKLQIKIGTFVT